jgi:small subunit ribosomal protein S16
VEIPKDLTILFKKMAVKLRLQRHGRKKKPFYHIVAVDARAPRDSKTIEKLGIYNPNTNPATIELNLDSAVKWLERGAQPTDTTRAILSYKGAIHKNHLNKGVKKGAFTQEEADAKFEAWLQEKSGKVQGKKDMLAKSKADIMAERLKAENQKNLERAQAIELKKSPLAEEVSATAEEGAEETAAESAAETDESPVTE